MAHKITIMLDEDLIKKVKNIQAKQLKNSTGSVSFSQVLVQNLKYGLKNKRS